MRLISSAGRAGPGCSACSEPAAHAAASGLRAFCITSARLVPGRAVSQVARLAACTAAVGCYVGLRSLLAVDQLVRIFRKVGPYLSPIPCSAPCVSAAAGSFRNPRNRTRCKAAKSSGFGDGALRGRGGRRAAGARLPLESRGWPGTRMPGSACARGGAAAAAGLRQRPRNARPHGVACPDGRARANHELRRAGGEPHTFLGARRRAPDDWLSACQARPLC